MKRGDVAAIETGLWGEDIYTMGIGNQETFTRICVTAVVFTFICIAFIGCNDRGASRKDEYLIRIDDNTVTVFEFNKALEIAKIAYPHNVTQDSKIYRSILMQLLNQMIEELIFMAEAARLNIILTDGEIKKAVNDIKKDYPDDEFEQTLLESAVSYDSWERRMRSRLLMEKLVKTQLEDKIIITKEDVLKYYEKNYGDKKMLSESTEERDRINETIVKSLKRQKAQDAYNPWVKNLKDSYKDKIKINEKRWKAILEL